MKKTRVKTNVLITIWFILFFNLGLIARIDNGIISACYVSVLAILWYRIGKRLGVI